MNTQLATQQYRLEQWTAIIRSRVESGMKVKDFCIQHDLSENACYYWLRKNRAAAINRGRLCDLLLFFCTELG